MTKRFTGWHFTVIISAFFGVVIAVNLTMAVFATRTFGGVVVENSYVASQKYNDWLQAARRQQKLAWSIEPSLDAERRVTIALSIDDAGPGIEPEAGAGADRAGHFGLLNMQQRAEAIGAILDVRRWPAGGTHVALDWRAR